MTRDFSEKAKQKLEGYADDAAASSIIIPFKVSLVTSKNTLHSVFSSSF